MINMNNSERNCEAQNYAYTTAFVQIMTEFI